MKILFSGVRYILTAGQNQVAMVNSLGRMYVTVPFWGRAVVGTAGVWDAENGSSGFPVWSSTTRSALVHHILDLVA